MPVYAIQRSTGVEIASIDRDVFVNRICIRLPNTVFADRPDRLQIVLKGWPPNDQ